MGPLHRPRETSLDQAQKPRLGSVEIGSSVPPPDPDVANAVLAVEGIEIDAVIVAFGAQEIVVDLGLRQVAMGDHLADRADAAPRPQLRPGGMAILEISFVFLDMTAAHVDRDAVLECVPLRIPDIG